MKETNSLKVYAMGKDAAKREKQAYIKGFTVGALMIGIGMFMTVVIFG